MLISLVIIHALLALTKLIIPQLIEPLNHQLAVVRALVSENINAYIVTIQKQKPIIYRLETVAVLHQIAVVVAIVAVAVAVVAAAVLVVVALAVVVLEEAGSHYTIIVIIQIQKMKVNSERVYINYRFRHIGAESCHS